MKKILLSIVACLSLTGELLAQKTSDFTYFQVVSVLNSGKVVLEPFSSPKRVGPIGNYDSTPENNRGYRLYRMRVKNLLEMYCKSRNWFPKKEWLEKYNLSYTFYFDREMKIFSYKISVNSDVFTEISEKQLKDIGEYFMEELDLHPYFCIAEDKKVLLLGLKSDFLLRYYLCQFCDGIFRRKIRNPCLQNFFCM